MGVHGDDRRAALAPRPRPLAPVVSGCERHASGTDDGRRHDHHHRRPSLTTFRRRADPARRPARALRRGPASSTTTTRTSTRTSPSCASIGYLAAAVPVHHGGWGLDLAQLAASQRRLARYAPATALAMTMHSYWTGIAAELERAGDPSLTWILQAAAAGEVFAAGHAEAGNDMPVLLSTCAAERVEGGYRLTGRKQFGSNGPAWTLARRPRHRRRRSGRPADRARLRRAHEPRRDRRRDLGHARHAARARATTPCSTACSCRTRRIGCVVPAGDDQRPVPRRHEHVGARR